MKAQKIGGGPGEKAGRIPHRLLPDTEVIGPPECPLMHRWTLARVRGRKLMVHHFLPNADDRVEHDHPASFITIVLAGGYLDHGYRRPSDRLRRGSVRFRRAEYRHTTQVGPHGCWTVVLMGPKRREWGFWSHFVWWPWRDHERLFGFGMRCPEEGEGR